MWIRTTELVMVWMWFSKFATLRARRTKSNSNSRISLRCSSVERLAIPARSWPEPLGEPTFEDQSGEPSNESVQCVFTCTSGSQKKQKWCTETEKAGLQTLGSRDQKGTCETRGLTLPRCSLPTEKALEPKLQRMFLPVFCMYCA